MSKVVVVKREDGKLAGLGEKADKAWARFRKTVADLAVGETLDFEYRQPRSPKFHRRYFGMLGALAERQEQFDSMDQLRSWLTVGAGYCDFVPGPRGRMVALPKSVAWARMDDAEFGALVAATWAFLRSEHAAMFLWGHLGRAQAFAAADQFLSEWDE